jgi:hypothetical protein
MTRSEVKRNCGRPIDVEGESPAQEVLGEHGEIFSCGGVYLGLNRPAPRMSSRFEFLHLPTYQKEVLVLNDLKVYRRPTRGQTEEVVSYQESSTPEEALRKFFKESLN